MKTILAILLFVTIVEKCGAVKLYLIASSNEKINKLLKPWQPKEPFELNFNKKQISWKICNTYNGNFRHNRTRTIIAFGPLASTKMLCIGMLGELERLVAGFFNTEPMRYNRFFSGNLHRLVNNNRDWLVFVDSKTIK